MCHFSILVYVHTLAKIHKTCPPDVGQNWIKQFYPAGTSGPPWGRLLTCMTYVMIIPGYLFAVISWYENRPSKNWNKYSSLRVLISISSIKRVWSTWSSGDLKKKKKCPPPLLCSAPWAFWSHLTRVWVNSDGCDAAASIDSIAFFEKFVQPLVGVLFYSVFDTISLFDIIPSNNSAISPIIPQKIQLFAINVSRNGAQ